MAMADSAARAIDPDAQLGFSQAVRGGGALPVSEQVATGDAREVAGVDDVDAPARRRLERALQTSGSSLAEVWP